MWHGFTRWILLGRPYVAPSGVLHGAWSMVHGAGCVCSNSLFHHLGLLSVAGVLRCVAHRPLSWRVCFEPGATYRTRRRAGSRRIVERVYLLREGGRTGRWGKSVSPHKMSQEWCLLGKKPVCTKHHAMGNVERHERNASQRSQTNTVRVCASLFVIRVSVFSKEQFCWKVSCRGLSVRDHHQTQP